MTFPAGVLRSTGVTRLPRYYDPLRLPAGPIGGYEFPPAVEPRSGPERVRPAGSPRFLTDLSTPAVPYHPGEPGRCLCSLLGGPVSGFARFGGLATLD